MTEQAMSSKTDASLHVIITDRQDTFRKLSTYVGIDPEYAEIQRILHDSVPAFVTTDFEDDRLLSVDDKRQQGKLIEVL